MDLPALTLEEAVSNLREWADTHPRPEGAVRLERYDRVAHLVLDNPDARNAVSVHMMAELGEHVLELRSWDGAFVVLRGEGPVFCAGGHLGQVKAWLGTPEEGHRMARTMSTVLDALQALPQVSWALLQGPAVGGGVELAMATDLRVMAPTAWLSLRQTALGVAAGWGGAPRLVDRVGPARALRLMLEGERISAKAAHALHLVDEVAERCDVWLHAWFTARRSVSTAAIRATKAQVVAPRDPVAQATAFAGVWGGPAHRAAMGLPG